MKQGYTKSAWSYEKFIQIKMGKGNLVGFCSVFSKGQWRLNLPDPNLKHGNFSYKLPCLLNHFFITV